MAPKISLKSKAHVLATLGNVRSNVQHTNSEGSTSASSNQPAAKASAGLMRRNVLAMRAVQGMDEQKVTAIPSSRSQARSPSFSKQKKGAAKRTNKLRAGFAANAFAMKIQKAGDDDSASDDEPSPERLGDNREVQSALQKFTLPVRAIAGLSLFRPSHANDTDQSVSIEGGDEIDMNDPGQREAIVKIIMSGLLRELRRRCPAAVLLPRSASGRELPIFATTGGASLEEVAALEQSIQEFNSWPDELQIRELDFSARRLGKDRENAADTSVVEADSGRNADLTPGKNRLPFIMKDRHTTRKASAYESMASRESELAMNLCNEETAQSFFDVLTSFPSTKSAVRVQDLVLDGQPIEHLHVFFKNAALQCTNAKLRRSESWPELMVDEEYGLDSLQALSLRRLQPQTGSGIRHLCLNQLEDAVLLRYPSGREMAADMLFQDSGLGCVLVQRVRERGKAESLGIRPGHRVLSLNGNFNLDVAHFTTNKPEEQCRLEIMAELESEFLESLRLPSLIDLDFTGNDISVGVNTDLGGVCSLGMSSHGTQDLFRFAVLFANFLREQPLVQLKLDRCNVGCFHAAAEFRTSDNGARQSSRNLKRQKTTTNEKDFNDPQQIFRSFVDVQFLKIMFGCPTNRSLTSPALTLRHLSLKQNSLTQAHARQLLSALEGPLSKLKFLDLRQNNLGNEGSLALVGGLRQHSYGALALTFLRLEQNHLTCDGAKRVLTELAQKWWLQVSLDVDNELEHAQIAAFAQFRVRHRWLQALQGPQVLVRLLGEELMASVGRNADDGDEVRTTARAIHLLAIDEVWEAGDTLKAMTHLQTNNESKAVENTAGLSMLHPAMCSKFADKKPEGHGNWHFLALIYDFANADGVHEMVAELLDDFLEACRIAVRLAPFPVQLALQLCAIFGDRQIEDEHSDDFKRLTDFMGSFAHIAIGELRAFRVEQLKHDKYFLSIVERTNKTQLEKQRGVVTHPRFQQILYEQWGRVSDKTPLIPLRIPAFFFSFKHKSSNSKSFSSSFLDLDTIIAGATKRAALHVGNAPFKYVNSCPRNIFMMRMLSTISFISLIYVMMHARHTSKQSPFELDTVLSCPEEGPNSFYDVRSCPLCPADVLYVMFCSSIVSTEALELYYSVLKNTRQGRELGESLQEGCSKYLESIWNFFDMVTSFFAVDTSIRLLFRIEQRDIKRYMGLLMLCSILRLLHIVALLPRVGPFVKMVFAMLKDIAMWAFVYLFVLAGFGAGFNALLTDAPTRLEESGNCAPGDEGCDSDALRQFLGFGTCLLNLFTISVGDNLGDALNLAMAVYEYGEGPYMLIGMIMFITVSTVLLLNLLIAIMSDTYRNIVEQSEAAYHLTLLGAHNESMHMAHTQQFQKMPPPFTLLAVALYLPFAPITMCPRRCVSQELVDSVLRLHVKVCCFILFCLVIGPFMLFMACHIPASVLAKLKTDGLDKKRMIFLPFFLILAYVPALLLTFCNVFDIMVSQSESFWKGKKHKKSKEADIHKEASSWSQRKDLGRSDSGSAIFAFPAHHDEPEAWADSKSLAMWSHPDAPTEEPGNFAFGKFKSTPMKETAKTSLRKAARALKFVKQKSDSDESPPDPRLTPPSPPKVPSLHSSPTVTVSHSPPPGIAEETEYEDDESPKVNDPEDSDVQATHEEYEEWLKEEAIKSKPSKKYTDTDYEIVLRLLKALIEAPTDVFDLARDENIRQLLHNEKEGIPEIRRDWIESWEDEYLLDRYRMRPHGTKVQRTGFEHRRNEIAFGFSLFGLAAPALSGDKGCEVARSAASRDVHIGLSDLQQENVARTDTICDLVKEQTLQIKGLLDREDSSGTGVGIDGRTKSRSSPVPDAGEEPLIDMPTDSSNLVNRRLGLILKSVQDLSGKGVVGQVPATGARLQHPEEVEMLHTRVDGLADELSVVRREVSELSSGVRDTFKHMMQEMSCFINQVHEGPNVVNPDLAAENNSMRQEMRLMRQEMSQMRSMLASSPARTTNGGRGPGDMYIFGDLKLEELPSPRPISTNQPQ